MFDFGLGDILFIILILGVIHGLMYLANRAKASQRKISPTSESEDDG